MKTKILSNGLHLIVHRKSNTKLSVLNVLYKVGSIQETSSKTGLAHLLEHMMFEGSSQFPNFDEALQEVLGENNAFTSQEYTSYFEILPWENLEKAIDLEIDRMSSLNLKTNKFKLQKSIVIEEYKETSINPPLSDNWHYLLKLAFKNSNYQWPVIGQRIDDVKGLEIKDLKQFYNLFYNPENAIVCVLADQDEDELLDILTSKFKSIVSKNTQKVEVLYTNTKKYSGVSKTLKRNNIHANSFFYAFHIPDFGSKEYAICDMISDYMSNGESSLLYYHLVKKMNLCTEISSYITDNKYNNLLIIEGKLTENTSIEILEIQLKELLEKTIFDLVDEQTILMLKNKAESFFIFNNYNMANLAQNLCFYHYCNIDNPIKTIPEMYQKTSLEDFVKTFNQYVLFEKRIELIYQAHSKSS